MLNDMLVYIINNNKLNVVIKDTIALKRILFNNITIIFNLINILYVSKLLTNLLFINTLIKREINVNFHDNKYRILILNKKQVLYAIKYCEQHKLQLARLNSIVIALIINYAFKYINNTFKL